VIYTWLFRLELYHSMFNVYHTSQTLGKYCENFFV